MNIGKILRNVGGAIGSAFTGNPLGFAGSAFDLIGNISGKSPQDQSIKAQQSENERNRQFNAEQAEKSYERQVAFWKMQQDYNTPAALMKRYKDAGLNPDLVYGEVSPVNPSSSSPTASYSGSLGSDLSAKRTIGDITSMALQIQREKAEIDNIEADTASKKASTQGQLTYNQFQEQLLQGQINMQNTNIMLGDWSKGLTEAETKLTYKKINEIDANINKLNAEFDNIKASTANLDADTFGKRIDNFFKSDIYKQQLAEGVARINKLNADANLSFAQADRIFKLLVYEQLNLASSTALNWQKNTESQVAIGTQNRLQTILDIRADGMSYDLTMNKTFGTAQRTLSFISGVQDIFLKPAQTLASFIGGAPAPSSSPQQYNSPSTSWF